MTSPQLSVRSARARILAHQLSQREKRPIHAIVEDALEQYAARYPQEGAATFLKRLNVLAVSDIELDGLIAERATDVTPRCANCGNCNGANFPAGHSQRKSF